MYLCLLTTRLHYSLLVRTHKHTVAEQQAAGVVRLCVMATFVDCTLHLCIIPLPSQHHSDPPSPPPPELGTEPVMP